MVAVFLVLLSPVFLNQLVEAADPDTAPNASRDPIVKTTCRNCNLILTDADLYKFMQEFTDQVAKVSTIRDRLAFHSICEECNVVLAEAKAIPDIVGIIMSAELGAAAAERAAREAADAAVRAATQAAIDKIKGSMASMVGGTNFQSFINSMDSGSSRNQSPSKQ